MHLDIINALALVTRILNSLIGSSLLKVYEFILIGALERFLIFCTSDSNDKHIKKQKKSLDRSLTNFSFENVTFSMIFRFVHDTVTNLMHKIIVKNKKFLLLSDKVDFNYVFTFLLLWHLFCTVYFHVKIGISKWVCVFARNNRYIFCHFTHLFSNVERVLARRAGSGVELVDVIGQFDNSIQNALWVRRFGISYAKHT